MHVLADGCTHFESPTIDRGYSAKKFPSSLLPDNVTTARSARQTSRPPWPVGNQCSSPLGDRFPLCSAGCTGNITSIGSSNSIIYSNNSYCPVEVGKRKWCI